MPWSEDPLKNVPQTNARPARRHHHKRRDRSPGAACGDKWRGTVARHAVECSCSVQACHPVAVFSRKDIHGNGPDMSRNSLDLGILSGLVFVLVKTFVKTF